MAPALPQRVVDIAQALRDRFVAPSDPYRPTDEGRAFIREIAEQVRYELGPAWGLKSAGVGRPQSPSVIAYQGEELGGWRLLDGDASVTKITNGIIRTPPYQSLPGQLFLPVDPINHLGVPLAYAGGSSPSEPSPGPVPSTDTGPGTVAELPEILKALHDLTDSVHTLDSNIVALTEKIGDLQAHGLKLRF